MFTEITKKIQLRKDKTLHSWSSLEDEMQQDKICLSFQISEESLLFNP